MCSDHLYVTTQPEHVPNMTNFLFHFKGATANSQACHIGIVSTTHIVICSKRENSLEWHVLNN